jgi:hypothetical protein
MDKYIRAESLKRKLIDEKNFFPVFVARALEEMPAEDVAEVKHGTWIEKEYNIDGEKSTGDVCSLCGASRVAGLGLAKYCYMCGAKMGGYEDV